MKVSAFKKNPSQSLLGKKGRTIAKGEPRRKASKTYPGKRFQTVCVRSISRKSRDLDTLGSGRVMVVMKGVSVRGSESEGGCVCESESESGCEWEWEWESH